MYSLKSASISLIAFLILIMPYIAVAATCATNSGGGSDFPNPLKYCSIREFVAGALQVFVLIMLPVIAFFIVLAGLNFVLSRGNAKKLETAKWNFFFVIIGTCLMLGAWLLANLIGATVTQVTAT